MFGAIFVMATRKMVIVQARMNIWRPLIRARYAKRISPMCGRGAWND